MNAILNKERKAKVLFVGNSYTYYNDMPKIFESIAKGEGADVEVYSVTKGGYTLEQLADVNDEYGKRADDILGKERFDLVFLQEQSRRPIIAPELFLKGAKALDAKIKANGARTVLYQTWGRKEGNAELYDVASSTREMAEKLADSYESVASELGCTLSKVGQAFLCSYEKHPEAEIYAPDGSHPNADGSYLAALCHYAVAYGEDPREVKYNHGTDEITAKILKEAAFEASK